MTTLVLVLVVGAVTATVALRSTDPSPTGVGHVGTTGVDGWGHHADHVATSDGVISAYDGLLPDGITPFNDGFAGVANLDPELLDAVRAAADDAADDGVALYVNSGWRSPEYQLQLLHDAVAEYGSIDEAARWVATPETSAHVSGDAVDIGSHDAATWLGEHGAAYGLCRTYRNEPWHFELWDGAADDGCPPMYADPTEDPRMHAAG